MIDTETKFNVVKIDELKVGDLFCTSKELERERFQVTNIVLMNHPKFVVGRCLETGKLFKWSEDSMVYIEDSQKG